MSRGTDRMIEVQQRLERATKWPWKARPYGSQDVTVRTMIGDSNFGYPVCYLEESKGFRQAGGIMRFGANCSNAHNDAELVAHAPQDLADFMKVTKAAKALMDAAAEFPGDPSAWGELMQGLDDALEALDGPRKEFDLA